MAQKLSSAGLEAVAEDKDGLGGLAVRFFQPSQSTAKWKVDLRAETDEGNYALGIFVVSPPGPTGRLSRVVAIAQLPGAKRWKALVTLVPGTEYDAGEISLSVGLPNGAAPGLIRVSERFVYDATAASAAIPIAEGETVLGWTAFAGPLGGILQIGTGSPIPIPANSSLSGGGGGLIEGPIVFDFTGDITGIYIEKAISA